MSGHKGLDKTKPTERIERFVSHEADGSFVIEHPDGRRERCADQTDLARLERLTEEDIVAAMRDDPDWAGFVDMDWSAVKWTRPVKKSPISLRLDADVLDYFKAEGPGYQTRMNDVLRAYVEHRTGKKKSA